jgi:hypothetical protein
MTVFPLGVPEGIYMPLGKPQEPNYVVSIRETFLRTRRDRWDADTPLANSSSPLQQSVMGLGANSSGGAIDIAWGAPAPGPYREKHDQI